MLLGTALGALSLPLPFLNSSLTGSVNGIEGDAWPAVVALLPLALASVSGDRRESFGSVGTLLAALAAAAATLFSVSKLVDGLRAVDSLQAIGQEASIGIGAWLLLGGSVFALFGAALGLSRRIG